MSEDQKKKISDAQRGRPSNWRGRHHSEETKRMLSESQRGELGYWFGKHHSAESNKKRSQALLGHPGYWKGKHRDAAYGIRLGNILRGIPHGPMSAETKQKLREINLGTHRSAETKQKMSEGRRAERHWNWQGGLSFDPYPLTWTQELKRSIRERDHYTCHICGKKWKSGMKSFDVHHIDYNKKNCNRVNLITLCHPCHARTHNNRSYWTYIFQLKRKLAA